MGDLSSDDDSSYNTPDDTPRRGDDKKRQRFSEVTEVIEIGKEDDSSMDALQGPPAPIRLTATATDDSTQSDPVVTIADLLGEGPEETVRIILGTYFWGYAHIGT